MHPVTLAAHHKAGPCARAVGESGGVEFTGEGRKLQPRINYENYQMCLIQMLAGRKEHCSLKLSSVLESQLQQAGQAARETLVLSSVCLFSFISHIIFNSQPIISSFKTIPPTSAFRNNNHSNIFGAVFVEMEKNLS